MIWRSGAAPAYGITTKGEPAHSSLRLFLSLARLHANVIFVLADVSGIVFRAGLPLIAALLAAALRLFGSDVGRDTAKSEQHDDGRDDGAHDSLPRLGHVLARYQAGNLDATRVSFMMISSRFNRGVTGERSVAARPIMAKTILIPVAAALVWMEVSAMADTVSFDADAVGAVPKGWTAAKTGRGEPKWTIEQDPTA